MLTSFQRSFVLAVIVLIAGPGLALYGYEPVAARFAVCLLLIGGALVALLLRHFLGRSPFTGLLAAMIGLAGLAGGGDIAIMTFAVLVLTIVTLTVHGFMDYEGRLAHPLESTALVLLSPVLTLWFLSGGNLFFAAGLGALPLIAIVCIEWKVLREAARDFSAMALAGGATVFAPMIGIWR
jgi:hypothetical protein